jgi:hypothetical protein
MNSNEKRGFYLMQNISLPQSTEARILMFPSSTGPPAGQNNHVHLGTVDQLTKTVANDFGQINQKIHLLAKKFGRLHNLFGDCFTKNSAVK